MNAKESIVFMFKGVSNWAPYWQFHFGEGGGFRIGHPISSFILGREGGGSNWAPYWQFYFGEGGGGTSAGRLVNFDSFSEIGYRTPWVFRMISEDQLA